MEENKEATPDWVHLPTGVEANCLWTALHDTRLFFVASDRLTRTATLKFSIFYLKDSGRTVTFRLEGVNSLRATGLAPWTGRFVRPWGITRDKEESLVAQYQAKGREETLSWSEIETSLGPANLGGSRDDRNYLTVSDAHIARDGAAMTLHVQGCLNDNPWRELYLRGSNLALSDSSGEALDLERLVALGDAWWDDFGREKTN